MATVTKPMALDESIKTTESTSRNIADVLAQELSGIASAITGGYDKANKTDIATVEPTNTASRAYSVGELVYVNGNLYKVITAITIGATFTVGTNIQSTNVSGTVKDALDAMPKQIGYVNVNISGIAINLADAGWYYAFVTIPNIPTGATCFSVMLGSFDANVIVNVASGNRIILQSPVSKTMPTNRNVIVFYYL
jgi:hypothetical protein